MTESEYTHISELMRRKEKANQMGQEVIGKTVKTKEAYAAISKELVEKYPSFAYYIITNGKNDISLSLFRPVAFEKKELIQGAYADFLADKFQECREKLVVVGEFVERAAEV